MSDSTGTILSTSICLPLSKDALTDRSHVAVNLLSCLSTLATHPPLTMEALAGSGLHKLDKESFNCVVRFNGRFMTQIFRELALEYISSKYKPNQVP